MGLILATGGKQATAGSLMCKNGVNLKLIREDNTDQMQALMATFAEGAQEGREEPGGRRALRRHHGRRLGDVPEGAQRPAAQARARTTSRSSSARRATAAARTSSWARAAWKQIPAKARGGLVAGVLRDGDWNIALKWLGDNKLPNNPDETSYDPEALNWVAASDYIDAAQKYVSGFCTELKNTKTGKKEKHCVDGVVTWTPGDVTVAEKKGGLVSIVSTKEYRMQMPNVIIGNKKWMAANRDLVKGMLAAVFAGGDQIKKDRRALKQGRRAVRAGLRRKGRRLLAEVLQAQRPEGQAGHERRARRLDRERPGREPPAVRPRRQDQLLRGDVHHLRARS